MKFRSCPAKHRPDLKGKPSELQEGEYYIADQTYNDHTYSVLYCKLPEEKTTLSGLPLNTTPDKVGGRACWSFDGNVESPTLSPSILSSKWYGENTETVWHGYLTAGRFEACE